MATRKRPSARAAPPLQAQGQIPNDSDLPGFEPGDTFLIRINAKELKRGILIPGHRLAPFQAPETRLKDLSIQDPEGIPINTRQVSFPLSDALAFFVLMGRHESQLCLLEEDPGNQSTLGARNPQNALVRLLVLDLEAFYKLHKPSEGDYLRFRFLDAEGGSFSIAVLKAADISPAERKQGLLDIREGFKQAMAYFRLPPESNMSLIRKACLFAPPRFRKDPSVSVSEFCNEGGYLDLIECMGNTFLWEKGSDIYELFGTIDPASLPPDNRHDPALSPLDAVFSQLELSLDRAEVEAYARDALFQKEGFPLVLDRLFAGLDRLGYDASLVEKAKSLSLDEMRRISSIYDAALDAQIAPLRHRLLKVFDRFRDWMRASALAGQGIMDLPREPMEILMGSMNEITALIRLLNEAENADTGAVKDIQKALPDLEAMVDELLETLSPASDPKPGRRRGQGKADSRMTRTMNAASASARAGLRISSHEDEEEDADEVEKSYLIRAELADIEPPIYRILELPGWFSLEDLHDALQIAFGWEDLHLHEFRFRKELYGPSGEDEMDRYLDESEYELEDLGLRARSSLRYIYDFGDYWEHKLTVLKTIRHAGEGPEYPRCLEGARAAPPEDCGGLPGYEEALRVKSLSKKKLSQEDREFLAWLGDWEPERFSLGEINKELEDAF